MALDLKWILSAQDNASTVFDKVGTQGKLAATEIGGAFDGLLSKFNLLPAAIGGVIAVVAGGGAFSKAIESTVTWADEVKKLSVTLGMTAQDASTFAAALEITGVSQDTATAAVSKLTKTLNTSEETFGRFHITVRDTSTGALLPLPQILGNTIESMSQMQTGTERNLAAQALFGRGWTEIQGIMKLTPEIFKTAADENERLNRSMSQEQLDAVKHYKEEMNKLKSTVEALETQIGMQLVGSLTKLAEKMNSADWKHSPLLDTFKFLLSPIDFVKYQASLFDSKNKGTTFEEWQAKNNPVKLTAKTPSTDNAETTEEYNARMAEIAEEQRAEEAYAKQVKSAHDAYINYTIKYNERQAALVKSANVEQEELNKNAYDLGEIDLQTYLDTKHQLTEDALRAEVDAKAKAVSEAAEAEQRALAAYKNDPTGDTAKNVNESYAKTEAAITANIDAVSKLNLLKIKDGQETVTMNKAVQASYQDIHTQYLTMTGDYIAAELAKQAAEKQTASYLQLEANAMAGNAAAIQALADKKKTWAADSVAAQNKENEAVRSYADEVAKMQDELDALNGKDKSLIDSESKLREGLDKMAALRDKITLSWAQGNAIAISGLSKQIQLQDQLNQKLQDQIKFQEDVAVLTGKIVGFSNGQAITSAGGGSFSGGQAVSQYQSASAAAQAQTATKATSDNPFATDPFFKETRFSAGVVYTDINGNPISGQRAGGGPVSPHATYQINEDGTEWLTMGSKGGYITPAGKTPPSSGTTTNHFSGPLQLIMPNVTNQTTAQELARQVWPELQKIAARQRAA